MNTAMNISAVSLAETYLKAGSLPKLPAGHFIDGKPDKASATLLQSFDAGLGQAFAEFASGDAGDVEKAVNAACQVQESWGATTVEARADLLQRISARIIQDQEWLAFVEALDSGKTLGEARSDVHSAAKYFQYYAAMARTLEGRSIPLGSEHMAWTMRNPVGVTAHIVPWNYPTSTFARSVAPALAAGCTVVAKPAETTPFTALLLAQIIHDCGAPSGVINVVTGLGSTAGAALVRHPKVRHVTFTGSVGTGVHVAQAAAPHIASLTLELGGKSPLVALSDCDLELAVDGALWAIYSNAGQVCSAGSRLVIERSIHQPFMERLILKTKALKVGHGLSAVDVGAINSELQLSRIDDHVKRATQRGRKVALGGHVIDGPGWFYAPTIVDNLPSNDPCVQEEIFGPVLAVQVVDDDAQALAAANATEFGLYAGIYSKDLTRSMKLARDIRAGQVTINDYWAGGVSVPFGGSGQSGYGRERGQEGIQAYLQTKAVVVKI